MPTHYSALIQQLSQLSKKRAELVQLSTSLNLALGDLTIQTASADSHPLVQALREEAYKAAASLAEVVNYTNRIACSISVLRAYYYILIRGKGD